MDQDFEYLWNVESVEDFLYRRGQKSDRENQCSANCSQNLTAKI